MSWSVTVGSLGSPTLPNTFVVVTGNGTLTATYATGYNVTFTEKGLGIAPAWTVTLKGSPVSSSTYTITYEEAGGIYDYAITKIPNFSAKYSGVVAVHGANVSVLVKFRSNLYSVSFHELGLPAEMSWSVSLNSTREFGVSASIGFGEINSTYTYQVWPIPGYSSNVTAGSVTVAGINQTIEIGFSQNTLGASGIPAKTWYAIGGVVGVAAIAGVALVLLRRKGT